MKFRLVIGCACVLALQGFQAQDAETTSLASLIDSLSHKGHLQKLPALVSKRVEKIAEKILRENKKTLGRLKKEEEKIYRKLLSKKGYPESCRNGVKAKLAEIQHDYNAQADRLKKPAAQLSNGHKPYIPYLDTLKTAFNFIDKYEQTGPFKKAMNTVKDFEERLQQAENIKSFIRERREHLKNQLEQLGLVNQLKPFNKKVYYFAAQITEYKVIFNNSKKLERKALDFLYSTNTFRDFFSKNSTLAFLFRMPGSSPVGDGQEGALPGLQARSQVDNLIQQQIAAGGPGVMTQVQQNLEETLSQLQPLKDKLIKSGSSSSEDAWDDSSLFGKSKGWAPNNQKTKSFWKRIEIGTNLQSQKPNSYFPVTTDFGLSLGYKLNDKSIIGIGTSYKLGWGQNINNINLSSQGAGLRCFVDWKGPFGSSTKGLFGGCRISGGYEMNYLPDLRNRVVTSPYGRNLEGGAWQKSGLLGLGKVLSGKGKFFKKTKLQLLWDFLSYEQKPKTKPVVLRFGYSFK